MNLTLDMFTRTMALLMGGQLDVQYGGENHHPIHGDVIQMHVDFWCDPERPYVDMYDATEKVLKPASNNLLDQLKLRNIGTTFDLPVDEARKSGYEAESHVYNGFKLRGLCQRNHVLFDEDGVGRKEVDLYRFDVLFRARELAS